MALVLNGHVSIRAGESLLLDNGDVDPCSCYQLWLLAVHSWSSAAMLTHYRTPTVQTTVTSTAAAATATATATANATADATPTAATATATTTATTANTTTMATTTTTTTSTAIILPQLLQGL